MTVDLKNSHDDIWEVDYASSHLAGQLRVLRYPDIELQHITVLQKGTPLQTIKYIVGGGHVSNREVEMRIAKGVHDIASTQSSHKTM